MEHAETYGQRHAAMQAVLRGTTYVLVLLMPFSVFFRAGPATNENVLAIFAERGFYLSDVPLAILLGLALIGNVPWRRGPILITVALAAICLLGFLSIPGAVSPVFTVYIAVRWLLALFLYFWFLQPVVSIKRLVLVLALGLALHAIAGIVQVSIQGPLNLPGELTMAPQISGAAILLVDELRWLRAYGLTFHPNVLGGYLAVALMLLVPVLERPPATVLWWLLWAGLLVTFSRSAWLAALLVMPVLLVILAVKMRAARWRIATAVGGALVVIIIFVVLAQDQVASRLGPLASLLGGEVPAEVEDPAQDPEGFSLSERAALMDLALEVISARPWRGLGAGNFTVAIPHLRPDMRAQSVHNVPLLLAAEVGVAGGVLWLLIAFGIVLRLVVYPRKGSPWLISAICAWLALVLISFFDSYAWSLNSGLLLSMMVLGLASRSVQDSK